MVENRSSLFGIIALVIGASGLGVGVFSVVNFQAIEGPQGPPGSIGIIVGLWDELFTNTDYAPYNTASTWLIEVDNIQVNNSNYFFLSRSNTRFHLNMSGWYRVNIFTLLESNPGSDYGLRVYMNDVLILHPVWVEATDSYVQFESSFYILGNSSNYFDFVVNGNAASSLHTNQIHHQLTIEYVGVY